MKDRSKVSIGKPCNTRICTLAAYAKRGHEQCIMLEQLSDTLYSLYYVNTFACILEKGPQNIVLGYFFF